MDGIMGTRIRRQAEEMSHPASVPGADLQLPRFLPDLDRRVLFLGVFLIDREIRK
jgi:hypothetical protein